MILDIVHGYQPFELNENLELNKELEAKKNLESIEKFELNKDFNLNDNKNSFVKSWAIENFNEIFLPLSKMYKEGKIKQNVQIQGWTLNSFKNLDGYGEFVSNLRNACESDNISLGCSLYNHGIAPYFSKYLIYALIKIDYDNVSEIFKPTFFFAPELAVDKKVLEIVIDHFDLIPIIPDNCIGVDKSDIIYVKTKTTKRKKLCLVSNVKLKSMLMNGFIHIKKTVVSGKEKNYEQDKGILKSGYKQYEEDELVDIKISPMQEPKVFDVVLKNLDTGKIGSVSSKLHVLTRDMENGQSRFSLDKDFVVKGFKKRFSEFFTIDSNFKKDILSYISNIREIDIKKIKKGSWEPMSNKKDPYPLWNKKSSVGKIWIRLIKIYEMCFDKLIFDHSNSDIELLKKRLEEKDVYELIKFTSPALISCVPWHYLAKKLYGGDPGLSAEMVEKIVRPKLIYFVKKVFSRDRASIIERINHLCDDLINLLNS